MHTLRLHDPGRRPANWTEIIQPHQFAAFARNIDTGGMCDADGRAFADPAAATCLVFDSIDQARRFCDAAVLKAPALSFDIFDAEGRARPPLVTVLHPSRAAKSEAHPGVQNRRRILAWALIAASVLVFVTGYRLTDGGHQVFAIVLGVNLLLAGGRLLYFNLGVRETERARQARLDDLNVR